MVGTPAAAQPPRRERVDERHQTARHRGGAGEVIAAVRVRVARLRNEAERERERRDADGHVDEEDPRPGEVLRQSAAEDEADGRAADRDRGPDGQRAGALGAFLEGRRDDRERGR